ncbi:Outer membrane protein ImpK/VasF, OmpA/MotB domain [hydrothermal vent metagenome]|uniref:Outer membrane protein ImpK/VasF, OmpA/MotB domain n=1 Tax=hydrothermal vent metagenome TaxID=652676 RepID=A0A1W1BCP2_9ZZZZ
MKSDKNRTVLIFPKDSGSKTRLINTEESSDIDLPSENLNYYDNLNEENPFLASAKGLFRETYSIINLRESKDIDSISRDMHKEMDRFAENLNKYGGDSHYLEIARYMMCTFCDELIANSSWASNRHWAEVSLLNYYHKESYGGDKFFQILDKSMTKPSKYINLLELAFVCLSFGFGGRYKQQNRLQELNTLKENLYRQIKNISSQKEKFYLDHPHATRHHKLYSKLSDKVILATVVVFMLLIYTAFSYLVSSNETPLIEALNKEHKIIESKEIL